MAYRAYHVSELRVVNWKRGKIIEDGGLCPFCQSANIENLKRWNDEQTLNSLNQCHNCEQVWDIRDDGIN